MRLVLVIPNLLGHDREALSLAPALAALARYAPPPALATHGTTGALFEVARMPVETAPAPVAAIGAGLDVGRCHVLHADPVTLVAGRDNVSLAGCRYDLRPAECAALVATLNEHFGRDGLTFCAPRADAWFVSLETAPALTTTPLEQVRGPLRPYLPQGADGPAWRRWLSEMQMLLHDHPVNIAREAAGLLPVTGIWVSGGGVLPPAREQSARIFAAPGSAGDVARGIAILAGQVAAPPPAVFAPDPPGRDTIAVLAAVLDRTDLVATDRAWLAPAIAALESGVIAHLTVIADGRGHAATWRAARPSLAARVRARLRTRAFLPPQTRDADDGA